MLVAPQYEEFTYNRRVPEQELLHQVLVEHLETWRLRFPAKGEAFAPHAQGGV